MAGGHGQRMARSLGAGAPKPVDMWGSGSPDGALRPKPLVQVRGVALLERNLVALLAAGLRDVTVTAPAAAPAIARFVESRGRALGAAAGASIECEVEQRPLGTIGAAARRQGRVDALLVVNADNLTAVDLRALLDRHRRTGAALTLAIHEEPLAIPFGEVRVEGDRVAAYVEKPRRPVMISSGIYVLGPAALEALDPGEPAGAPALVERLLARGADVRAYTHAAPWIDVNDREAIERAEALVAAREDLFEWWPRAPDVEVAGALILGPGGLLLEWRPAAVTSYPVQWDTPGGKIEPGEEPADAIVRELREELGLEVLRTRPVAVFDDLDTASARLHRHHIFEVDVRGAQPVPRLGQALRWMPLDGTPPPTPQSPVVRRSLAAWRALTHRRRPEPWTPA